MQEAGLLIDESGATLSDATALITIAIAFAVGAVVAIGSSKAFGLRRRGAGRRSSDRWLVAFFSVFAFTLVLICPVLFITQDNNPVTTAPLVLVRLLQAVSIDNGFVDFISGTPASPPAIAYYFLLGCAYVCLPVLAIFNIVDQIKQRMADVKVWYVVKRRVKGKNVLLFNDFNDDAFGLAKDALEADGRSFVVFSAMSKTERDTWSTEINELGDARASYLEVDYPSLAVRLCERFRFAALSCFAISRDCAKNVSETCTLISSLRARSSGDCIASRAFVKADGEGGWDEVQGRARALHIYVLYDSADDELVIDAANRKDSGKRYATPQLPVTMLREATMAAYSLFDNAPLFDVLGEQQMGDDALRPAEEQGLSVLIIGSGDVAEEVMKVVLWCGQMHNVSLDVTVVDDHASQIRDRVSLRYPAICAQSVIGSGTMQNAEGLFTLEFKDLCVQSANLDELCFNHYIEKGCKHLYIIVALDDDALSHEIAMHTRLFFLDKAVVFRNDEVRTHPFIACQIRDKAMASLINSQFDESIPGYGIYPFGCSRALFSYGNIVDSPLERVGEATHQIYDALYTGITGAGAFRDDNPSPRILRKVVDKVLRGQSVQARLIGIDGSISRIACQPQIEHYSNLAVAMHTRYKAWALGFDDAWTGDVTAIPDKALVSLGNNEHERWTVYYQTQGYTHLNRDSQEYYSRLLKGDNQRRKIGPLKKHVLVCANDEIWDNYIHAQSGFSYLERSGIHLGSDGATVTIKRSDDIAIQLLDDQYRVLIDWPSNGDFLLEVKGLPVGTYRVHPIEAVSGQSCASDVEFNVEQSDLSSDSLMIMEMNCLGDNLVNPVVYDWAFAFATPYLKDLFDCKNIMARRLFCDGGDVFRKTPGLTGFKLTCATEDAFDAYNMFEDVIYCGKGYYVSGLEGEQWKVRTLEDIVGSYVFDGTGEGRRYAKDGAELNADLLTAIREKIGGPSAPLTIPIRYKDANGTPIMALRAPDDIKFIERGRPDPNASTFKVNCETNRFGKRITHGGKHVKHGRTGDMLACPMIEITRGEELEGDVQKGVQGHYLSGYPLWDVDGQLYYADLSEMYVINGRIFSKTYSKVESAVRE